MTNSQTAIPNFFVLQPLRQPPSFHGRWYLPSPHSLLLCPPVSFYSLLRFMVFFDQRVQILSFVYPTILVRFRAPGPHFPSSPPPAPPPGLRRGTPTRFFFFFSPTFLNAPCLSTPPSQSGFGLPSYFQLCSLLGVGTAFVTSPKEVPATTPFFLRLHHRLNRLKVPTNGSHSFPLSPMPLPRRTNAFPTNLLSPSSPDKTLKPRLPLAASFCPSGEVFLVSFSFSIRLPLTRILRYRVPVGNRYFSFASPSPCRETEFVFFLSPSFSCCFFSLVPIAPGFVHTPPFFLRQPPFRPFLFFSFKVILPSTRRAAPFTRMFSYPLFGDFPQKNLLGSPDDGPTFQCLFSPCLRRDVDSVLVKPFFSCQLPFQELSFLSDPRPPRAPKLPQQIGPLL